MTEARQEVLQAARATIGTAVLHLHPADQVSAREEVQATAEAVPEEDTAAEAPAEAEVRQEEEDKYNSNKPDNEKDSTYYNIGICGSMQLCPDCI